MPPRVCLFVGPSLSADEIRGAFKDVPAEVTVHPPVEQGDILRLMGQLPDVIGILDGHFFHRPSVLHREILLALERGARVLGASSIGALRAAELDVFGMEGVGEVYRLYKSDVIDGDDEVAIVHAPASEAFLPLTEPLVNVRHNLELARRGQIISAQTAVRAVVALKRLHFSQRLFAAVLAAVPEHDRGPLARFLAAEGVDLKRRDALELVRTIAARIVGAEPWPPRAMVPVPVQQTAHFVWHRHEYEGHEWDAIHVPTRLALAFERLLSPSFSRHYARVAQRCVAVEEAPYRGLAPADPTTLVERFRHARRLTSDRALQTWLTRRSLTVDELVDVLRARDLEARVLASYRSADGRAARTVSLRRAIEESRAKRDGTPAHRLVRPLRIYPGISWPEPLILEFKYLGRFSAMIDVAGRILRNSTEVFARHPWLEHAPVRRGLLLNLFAERWKVARERFDEALLARGLAGDNDFTEPARHIFIYLRTSEGSYDPVSLTDCFHVDRPSISHRAPLRH